MYILSILNTLNIQEPKIGSYDEIFRISQGEIFLFYTYLLDKEEKIKWSDF